MGNTRLRLGHRLTAIVTTTMLLFLFQNCGQPGQLTPTSLQVDGLDTGDTGSGTPDTNPPPVYAYKDFMKDINILAPTNKLDVLVVVDNSGSMEFEQMNMATRMSSLIQKLNGLDWRVAVTTTEVNFDDPLEVSNARDAITGELDGELLNMGQNKHWVTSQDDPSMAQQLFANTIQRNETGSSREQGIKATYRFLERSLVLGSKSSQFLRPDAALSVVVVSDANETPYYGFLTKRNNPDRLIELVSLQYPTKAFSFHSIIVKKDDQACLTFPNSGNEGFGLSYQYLSEKTAGIVGSVCEMDYSSQLSLIGSASAQLVKNVSLECVPVDSDKDGMLDFKITPMVAGTVIPSYTLQGTQVMFTQPLLVGLYKFEYRCLVQVQ